MRIHSPALLLAFAGSSLGAAQTPRLEVPWIMGGPELVGREPTDVRWSPDGEWILFRWLPPGSSWRESLKPSRVRAAPGAVPEALTPAVADSLAPLFASGPTSRDGRRRVVSVHNDLFLIELPSAAIRHLTDTPAAAEGDPSFDAAGARVIFRRDLNLFAFDLTTLAVKQLTDIRPGPSPDSAVKVAGQRGFVASEERALISAVRDRLWRDSVDKAEREARERTRPKPFYLNKNEQVTRLVPSPAGAHALVFTETTAENRRAQVPTYVTALPRDYSQRHLVRVDVDSARWRSIDVLRDTAWVGGPCFGWAGWLPADRGVWFISESDGYAHLYTAAPDGSNRTQRTAGRWEVLRAALTPDRTAWALHTSEAAPFERHFYLLPVAGGERNRLTNVVGGHSVELSPDGRMLADVQSAANRPPELFLQAASLDAAPVRLTTSPTPDWLRFPWIAPEVVWVPASDGARVPARIYRARPLGAKPNGAAVIFVHGAGYLHNVHNYWSDYFREYMFHRLLAQRGFVVLDLDYRASAGYGRDWRTAIYRHMGGRDLQDQVDGARYLNRELGVSFDRIGIYGGSYGGFITLMALFTEGRFFGAGAALRSVTDWAHYNHPYTAAILNEPQDDSIAFRRSSPIHFAEGLADPLLMAHGMVDVNVHFQGIVRLSERLIELGKTRWELAVYPVEDHAFVDSWTDEYRRILDLFERSLLRDGETGRRADETSRSRR